MVKRRWESSPESEEKQPTTPERSTEKQKLTKPKATYNPQRISDPGPISYVGDYATVIQVREYIIDVLYGCYAIPLEEAQRVAEEWQNPGYYFRRLSLQQFEEYFGKEYAALLDEYKRLIRKYEQYIERAKMDQERSNRKALILFVSGIFSLIVFCFGLHILNTTHSQRAF